MEYYPGLQLNELEWHESPWINLRNLMLSEKGKWQNSTYINLEKYTTVMDTSRCEGIFENVQEKKISKSG